VPIKRKYTDADFVAAVKNSYSMAQVLRKLDLSVSGGNYKLAKLRIRKLEIDSSHFTGQGHLKGKSHNWTKAIPLDEILIQHSMYASSCYLKKKIAQKGALKKQML